MKKTTRFVVLVFLALFSAFGQSHAQQTAPAQQTPAPTQAIDPKTLAAAKELVRSFDMNTYVQSVFSIISKTIMPMILRDNPNQAQQIQQITADAVQKAFMAHMDELANNKAIVYAQMYSYDELQQLKAFYQSPVGQKMLKTMPEMMQRSLMLDKDIILKAVQESKQDLRDALQKNGLKVPKEMAL